MTIADLAEEIVTQASQLTLTQRRVIEQMKQFNTLANCKCCQRHQSRRPKDIGDFTYTFVKVQHILEDGSICDWGEPNGTRYCIPSEHYTKKQVVNWAEEAKLPEEQLEKDFQSCNCTCRHKMRKFSMCILCDGE